MPKGSRGPGRPRPRTESSAGLHGDIYRGYITLGLPKRLVRSAARSEDEKKES